MTCKPTDDAKLLFIIRFSAFVFPRLESTGNGRNEHMLQNCAPVETNWDEMTTSKRSPQSQTEITWKIFTILFAFQPKLLEFLVNGNIQSVVKTIVVV